MKSATSRGFSGAGVWEGGSAAAMVKMDGLEKRLQFSQLEGRPGYKPGAGTASHIGLVGATSPDGKLTGMSRGGRD